MRDRRGGYTSTTPATDLNPPPGASGVKHRGTITTPHHICPTCGERWDTLTGSDMQWHVRLEPCGHKVYPDPSISGPAPPGRIFWAALTAGCVALFWAWLRLWGLL